MAYYSDLNNECDIALGNDLRAIGWLSKNHPFITDFVNNDFLHILKNHIEERWTIVVAAGTHDCEFCFRFSSGGNVIIPTETVVYIAPEMISHYIEAHNYQPPDEFIQAVISCPQQGSPRYMKLIEKFMYLWN